MSRRPQPSRRAWRRASRGARPACLGTRLPSAALAALGVAALVMLGACSDRGAAAPSGAVREELLTDVPTMMGWIEAIVAQGIRRPGYPADEHVEQWARDRFAEIGLEDVTLDPVEVDRWEPLSWSLTVWHDDAPDARLTIPCYAVPFSGESEGLEADIVLASGDRAADPAGRIAVIENGFLVLPQTILSAFATWIHDPTNEVQSHVQTLPFSGNFAGVMEPLIERGAVGFVGILRGLPWETDRYYVPYDAEERPIPGVWVSASNGDRLLAFLAEGPSRGRIELRRRLEKAVSHNVTGVLRGASEQWIVVGSHHDGPWASAVEDAGGVALVLAQARYWARVPQRERPHNLLFLLNAGHMSGGAGLVHFVETRRDFVSRDVVVEIHLEHPAREGRGENGALVPTDAPEFRWWFTSFIPTLEEAVASAICAEDLGRSYIMPPEGFPPGSANPPTDAAFFHPRSPIVSFLTAPMYLFDEADTVAMVHEESLVPLTRATVRIIESMRGVDGAALRAAVYQPPRASAIPPCPPRG